MADIVFVPGSYHGGWYFDEIARDLSRRGHRVIAPTLTGLGEGPHDYDSIDLDRHIDDVLAVIDEQGARDVILIGHSYGGMVITGVAARKRVSLRQLVYLDAMLPLSGESLWDLIPDALRASILAASSDGVSTAPPRDLADLDPRVVPHPIRTYRQPAVYDDGDLPRRKAYVWAAGNPGSPFATMYDRVARDPDWQVVAVPYGHDLMREAPEPIAQLIAELIDAPEQENRA
jgi:pimeloyl-ACP methyl ester carboxylesterase